MMEHSNIVKHNICEGRGFKDVYWKVLTKGDGWEEEGKGE
jgi:hypothetical protein